MRKFKQVLKPGKVKKDVTEISSVTGKPKIQRNDRGREAAAKAATMTKDEWKAYQTEKYQMMWPKPDYMQSAEKTCYVRDGGEGAYRDRTYEIITRWTAKTKIAYRPHAKAPGTKSHLRYEKYAAAKTVGEALALGSWPLDWCFDYEHGFIQVLGGPVREEPLDISKVEDESKLTEVDRCLVSWFRRELAKRYNLKVQDLLVEKAGGETVLMRAHRLVADRKAGELMALAARERRPVADAEVEAVLSTWAFAKNNSRQNVVPEGQSWVYSDTLGLLRDRSGDIHLTSATRRYSAFTAIMNSWLRDRLPAEVSAFKFTSVNLNCNYAARRHRDGNNFGPSMIRAFSGGELRYFAGDDRSSHLSELKVRDCKTVDIATNLAMFNGNSAHEVNDFLGSRFSVVYFSLGCHARASEEAKAELHDLGFAVPSADEDPHALLGPPGSTTEPTLRVWKASTLGMERRKGRRKWARLGAA